MLLGVLFQEKAKYNAPSAHKGRRPTHTVGPTVESFRIFWQKGLAAPNTKPPSRAISQTPTGRGAMVFERLIGTKTYCMTLRRLQIRSPKQDTEAVKNPSGPAYCSGVFSWTAQSFRASQVLAKRSLILASAHGSNKATLAPAWAKHAPLKTSKV